MDSNAPQPTAPRVKLFGVGTAGIAMLTQVAAQPWASGRCTALHTSAKVLNASVVPRRLLMGEGRLHGLGCGGDPALAREIGAEEKPILLHLCEDADLVFILTGLGGGAGSGLSAALAEAARETGALVMVMAALPFSFEGSRRQAQARAGLAFLKATADVVMCLPNQKCARLLTDKATLPDIFSVTNQMAADAIRSITQMLTHPGLINLDFSYLYSVLRGKDAESAFAVGRGSGEHRAQQAIDMVLNSPLLDGGKLLADSEHIVVSIASGSDLTLVEVDAFMSQLERRSGKAQVVVGASVDPALEGQLEITVIASYSSGADSETSTALAVRSPIPAPDYNEAADASFFSFSKPQPRPPSRFTAPPPILTPEQTERIFKQQVKRNGRKSAANRMQQGTLPLEIVSRGRFDKTDPTILQGEDLDIPTFVRRGMGFN